MELANVYCVHTNKNTATIDLSHLQIYRHVIYMEIKPAIRTSVAEVHGDDGDGADVNLKKTLGQLEYTQQTYIVNVKHIIKSYIERLLHEIAWNHTKNAQ